MKSRLYLLPVLLVICLSGLLNSTNVTASTDVLIPGSDNLSGAMPGGAVTQSDGSQYLLIAGNNDVLYSTSINGSPWTAPQTIVSHSANWTTLEPSLLVLADGTMFLKYDQWTNLDDSKQHITKSVDGGKTWSEDIWVDTGYPYNVGPFNGLQLQDGTLVWGFSSYRERDQYHVGFLRSTDNGTSWQVGGWIDASRYYDEPVLAELSDGSVYTLLRTFSGALYYSISKDSGLTWSIPKPTTMISPSSPGQIIKIGSTTFLASWNYSLSTRNPLVIAQSFDDCKTWSAPVIVAQGESESYSQILWSASDNIITEWWWSQPAGQSLIRGRMFNYDMLTSGTPAPMPVAPPPQHTDSGGGGGGGGAEQLGITSLVGRTNADGKLLEDLTAKSGDKILTLEMTKGTALKNYAGGNLYNLIIRPNNYRPPSTPDYRIVGEVYQLQPGNATVTPQATLSIAYKDLPDGWSVEMLTVVTWDGKEWVELDSTIADGKVSTQISHFSDYALSQRQISFPDWTVEQFADEYLVSVDEVNRLVTLAKEKPEDGELTTMRPLDKQALTWLLNLGVR